MNNEPQHKYRPHRCEFLVHLHGIDIWFDREDLPCQPYALICEEFSCKWPYIKALLKRQVDDIHPAVLDYVLAHYFLTNPTPT